jgi:enterochelin esterase-like enzyme
MNLLPPVLAVLPGLNSTDNYVPSLGINMLRTDVPHGIGLGSGRFGDYLTEELFPKIEADYPQVQGGIRLGAGFSLGGYTISMLAARLPGYFQHMGIYDGLFMWPHHEDPRHKPVRPFNDRVWLEAGIFDAAFGKPRDREALTTWNPADAIQQASRDLLHRLRETTWWISCAAGDGNRGNRDRATFFADLLAEKGIPLGFESVHFHKEAAHSWHWNDRFLIRYLKHVLK